MLTEPYHFCLLDGEIVHPRLTLSWLVLLVSYGLVLPVAVEVLN
jgi:hypothetical protein